MRRLDERMPTSFSPPAKQTVTQVPQPTRSTLFAFSSLALISSNGFCSATIMLSSVIVNQSYDQSGDWLTSRLLTDRLVDLFSPGSGLAPGFSGSAGSLLRQT